MCTKHHYRKNAGELWLPTEPPGKGAQAGSRETLHPVSGGPGCCTAKHIGRPRTVVISVGMHPLSARGKRMVHNNCAAAARRRGTLAAPHVRTSQVTSTCRRWSPGAAASPLAPRRAVACRVAGLLPDGLLHAAPGDGRALRQQERSRSDAWSRCWSRAECA